MLLPVGVIRITVAVAFGTSRRSLPPSLVLCMQRTTENRGLYNLKIKTQKIKEVYATTNWTYVVLNLPVV
jgi:hypothetical protein